ncbi:MAG: hypothetical protein U0452_03745 [Anaerolineae bacterium]
MRRFVIGCLVIIGMLIIVALPVLAGSLTFTGTLSLSDPIYVNGRPDDADCADQIDDLLPNKYHYQTRLITVSATGTYTYTDLRSSAGTIDIEVAIYNGTAFDPNNPRTNCISSMDDSNLINLEAGKTYLIAITSWDMPNVGDYAFQLSGLGDVTQVVPAEGCNVSAPANSVLRTLPADTPAYFEPDASKGTHFNIPAGTWYTYGTSGDFTHLWVTCGANPVWVATSALN